MGYFFQSARLGFRTWKPSDLEPFAAINADDQVMTFFPKRLNKEESAHFIEIITAHFHNHGFGWYATDLLETNEFIGFIGFKRFDLGTYFSPAIEIGWRLAAHHWGKGLATEGALACLGHGWQSLGFQEVYSFTACANHRSARVMQKIGMQKVDEFNHPKVAKGHVLERHVLYYISQA